MCLYQEYAPFDDDGTMDDQTVVPLNELACGLLAVDVDLNGVRMPALVDTGAPRTIINRAAAKAAGIATVDDASGSPEAAKKPSTGGFKNPFAAIQDAISRGREQALGSSGAVTVMGAGGRPERLDKASRSKDVEMIVSATSGSVCLSSPQILIGDLEAFRVGLGLRGDSTLGANDGQPGIVLGLDALMSVPKVAMRTTPGNAKMKFFV
jgi:hypothetical protein